MEGLKEENLHLAVCNYLRMQYPDVLFNSDMSGVKLTMGQAIKAKRLRSCKGFPDLVIYEPRGNFKALFLELKREGEVLLKKNGDFKSEHLKEQAEVMQKLIEKGYYCVFAIGFDNAKYWIDIYLSKKNG